jgi:beta-phosphoglucomutase-like phosphatase (HAD superfamily)
MAAREQTRWAAVLFDFDGILGDTSISSSALRATAAELPGGYAFDEALIRPWSGQRRAYCGGHR